MIQELRVTGVYVQYYFICTRKLWFFAGDITMEDKSDLVHMGKIIDEHSYAREQKHITIDETISIDFIDNKGLVNEVKKSRSMERADIQQLKYYLYYLHTRGVENVEGMLDYPKLKQKQPVALTEQDMQDIPDLLRQIEATIRLPLPPPAQKTKVCKKCSYFELCFI